MANIVKDRVLEFTNVTGFDPIQLNGSPIGYRRFGDVLSDGDECYYTLVSENGDWETGISVYDANLNTLDRGTVTDNSAGSNAQIPFQADSKKVFLTFTAQAYKDLLNEHSILTNRLNSLHSGINSVAESVDGMKNFVSLKEFGAIGDGVTDDTDAISDAINLATITNIKIDLQGKTYAVSPISVNVENSLTLMNGAFVCYGEADKPYMIRIRTTSNISLFNVIFDGRGKVCKALLINANSEDTEINVDKCVFKNTLQTNTATSTASGLQVEPEQPGGYFSLTRITNSEFSESSSVRDNPNGDSLISVGRGLTIFDCKNTIITGCSVNNIGPHWDGDGISVGCDSSIPGRRDSFSLLVANSIFRDCQKRSIKSQVGNSIINNIVCERSQYFPYFGGQSEISLLEGGKISNIMCKYADGAAPRDIVSIGWSSSTDTSTAYISDISVVSENNQDVIQSLCGFFLSAPFIVPQVIVRNSFINCKVKNILYLHTSNQGSNITHWDRVHLYNITVKGFNTHDVEHSVVFVTRGSNSYNNSNIILSDITSLDNSTPPFSYLDPAPGSTSFLSTKLIESSNTSLAAVNGEHYYSPTIAHRYTVAENSTFSKTFNLKQVYSGLIITVMYTSSRDSLSNKLFTSGVIQSSSNRTYYQETVAGTKSSAQTGGISINQNVSENSFSVTKTAGSTASTGHLLVLLQDIGYTNNN